MEKKAGIILAVMFVVAFGLHGTRALDSVAAPDFVFSVGGLGCPSYCFDYVDLRRCLPSSMQCAVPLPVIYIRRTPNPLPLQVYKDGFPTTSVPRLMVCYATHGGARNLLEGASALFFQVISKEYVPQPDPRVRKILVVHEQQNGDVLGAVYEMNGRGLLYVKKMEEPTKNPDWTLFGSVVQDLYGVWQAAGEHDQQQEAQERLWIRLEDGA